MKRLMLIAAAVAVAAAAPTRKRYTTSATRSTAPGVLNVALIPHTHDDVGWLKTVDEYYYGARNNIQHANVQSIITAAITELAKNPDRRFSYVEQAFFQRWWSEQDEATQGLTRDLVATGQLEFINGGWCMHDEANPSYVDMIDQTTLGHRWIQQEFGVQPKVTWQIDPFGHSAFNAYMMSSAVSGFSAVYFARSDYQDFAARSANASTEFFWYPSPSLGKSSATLGGILYDYYYPPSDLNFGGDDNTEPIMDDPALNEYNVQQVVQTFLNSVAGAHKMSRGNDVMMMMGTDFSYENAVTWFRNLDKLIHYVNLNTSIHGVHAYYGTPSIYTQAKLDTVPDWPQRSDDMMPYGDGPHAYWSGYFTSRTALKAYIRDSSGVMQALRQAQAFGSPPADLSQSNPLYRFERALGVTQHHDAVAGTSKQAVAYDYAQRLSVGRGDGVGLMNDALNNLTNSASGSPGPLTWASCDLANATICDVTVNPSITTSSGSIMLSLWNSQSQAKSMTPVLVPVSIGGSSGIVSWTVTSPVTGMAIPAQIIPATLIDIALRTTYYNWTYSGSGTIAWLAFQAVLPAAGYAVYGLTPSASAEEAPLTFMSTVTSYRVAGTTPSSDGADDSVYPGVPSILTTAYSADQVLTNGIISITVDGTTGYVKQMSNANNGLTIPLTQSFLWYNSSNNGGPNDGTSDWGQTSGAYIFRPNVSAAIPIAYQTFAVVTGPIVQQVVQCDNTAIGSSWASNVVRLWNGSSTSVDFEWTIGPIPWSDGLGKEIVTRYETGLASKSVWYTDSNGRDSMKRTRNARPSWNYTVEEPVAGNYYPVNAFTYLSDATTGTTFSVVTDRSNGGSSMQDGNLELMVHRRLQADDNRGVGEPLNETGVNGLGLIVRGLHRITLDPSTSAASSKRAALADQLFPPIKAYAPLPSAAGSPAQWFTAHVPTFSGLAAPLPANVHLLTVHAHSQTSLLIRLAHQFETGEDASLSQNVTVSIATLFSNIVVNSCVETTLTANQPLSSAPVYTYNLDDGSSVSLPVVPAPPSGPSMSVTLSPMEIRTFMCQVGPKE